ncbi:hypothetical protein LIER_09000 [Lithospermum erythrorhizon]|uniref:DUF4283 domain-containing protein n=1 Tax=Lithospermum erythrorhizon TaxID=34254 RepID=A0AAV3PIU9_LITER
MKLTFIPPEEVNGKSVVKYQSIDVILGINRWRSAAYGYVMGINPNFASIERFANSRWAKYGFEKLYKVSSGLFIFQFSSDEERDQMLTAVPDDFESWRSEGLVWFWIPFFSLQFWNAEMFSKIGSFLGNPNFADGATSEMTRVSYARIYLEVEAKNEIPKFVPLAKVLNSVSRSIAVKLQIFAIYGAIYRYFPLTLCSVECGWRPPVCSHCQVFGHDLRQCRYGEFHQWRRWSSIIILVWRKKEAAVLVDVPTSHVEEVALNESEHDSIVHHHTPPFDVMVKVADNFAVLDQTEKESESGEKSGDESEFSEGCAKWTLVHNQVWLVGGDFNIVRASSEPDIGAMCEFNDCVKDTEVSKHLKVNLYGVGIGKRRACSGCWIGFYATRNGLIVSKDLWWIFLCLWNLITVISFGVDISFFKAFQVMCGGRMS